MHFILLAILFVACWRVFFSFFSLACVAVVALAFIGAISQVFMQ